MQLYQSLLWKLYSVVVSKTIQQKVKTTRNIIKVSLIFNNDPYQKILVYKAPQFMNVSSHSPNIIRVFTPLLSGRRYQNIWTITARLCDSFYPHAVRLSN